MILGSSVENLSGTCPVNLSGFTDELVADGESHCPEIFDRKDRCGAGVALPEGVDLPDAGNKLGKVTDHLGVIEVLVAELLFIVKVVLQSALDFRETHIEDRLTTQYPFFLGNVAVAKSAGELEDTFKDPSVNGSQTGGGEGESLFVEQLGNVGRNLVSFFASGGIIRTVGFGVVYPSAFGNQR